VDTTDIHRLSVVPDSPEPLIWVTRPITVTSVFTLRTSALSMPPTRIVCRLAPWPRGGDLA